MTAVLNAQHTWILPAQPQQRAMTAGEPPAPGRDDSSADGFQDTRPVQPVVLLVEDNHINQVVALEFLSLMGLQTQLAQNGFEAIETCLVDAPDLVLMDIQMPGMDGLECTRRLRELQAEGRLPSFPILALTAHALESDVQASKDAGMNEHLTKPLDFASLRTRLGRWLDMPEIN